MPTHNNISHKLNWKRFSIFKVGELFLVAGILLFAPVASWANVSKKLTREEQEDLKLLFHQLFAENELGYTLFGDKPMSFCFPDTCWLGVYKHDHIFEFSIHGNKPVAAGFRAWRKLQKQISTPNYSLILYEHSGHPIIAIFINKRAFRDAFNKNADIFRLKYPYGMTADEFLAALESKKIPLEEFIYQHFFMGVMLGFGRHNAELFERRDELSKEDKRPFLRRARPVKASKEIEQIDARLQRLNKKDSLLYMVIPIYFAADFDHPETLILKKKYEAMHKKLTAIFKQDDWLDIVLEKMMQK